MRISPAAILYLCTDQSRTSLRQPTDWCGDSAMAIAALPRPTALPSTTTLTSCYLPSKTVLHSQTLQEASLLYAPTSPTLLSTLLVLKRWGQTISTEGIPARSYPTCSLQSRGARVQCRSPRKQQAAFLLPCPVILRPQLASLVQRQGVGMRTWGWRLWRFLLG